MFQKALINDYGWTLLTQNAQIVKTQKMDVLKYWLQLLKLKNAMENGLRLTRLRREKKLEVDSEYHMGVTNVSNRSLNHNVSDSRYFSC